MSVVYGPKVGFLRQTSQCLYANTKNNGEMETEEKEKKRELMECSCQGDETGRRPKHKYTFGHGKQEKCPFLQMFEVYGSVGTICISGAFVQMTREKLSGA